MNCEFAIIAEQLNSIAKNVLRGKCSDLVPSLIDGGATAIGQTQGSVADMISDALESLLGNK